MLHCSSTSAFIQTTCSNHSTLSALCVWLLLVTCGCCQSAAAAKGPRSFSTVRSSERRGAANHLTPNTRARTNTRTHTRSGRNSTRGRHTQGAHTRRTRHAADGRRRPPGRGRTSALCPSVGACVRVLRALLQLQSCCSETAVQRGGGVGLRACRSAHPAPADSTRATDETGPTTTTTTRHSHEHASVIVMDNLASSRRRRRRTNPSSRTAAQQRRSAGVSSMSAFAAAASALLAAACSALVIRAAARDQEAHTAKEKRSEHDEHNRAEGWQSDSRLARQRVPRTRSPL